MLRLIAVLGAALVVGGCASFNRLDSDVSTYGAWPPERKPATYVFERLPSQQAEPQKQQQQQVLEDSARAALQGAGFTASDDANGAEYLMQVGARVFSDDPWIYNDPLFWRGPWGWRTGFHGRGYGWGGGWGPGWGYGGFGPYPGFGPYDGMARYSREIALVIRDRRSGQVLYETRANNTGMTASIDALLPAMFEAALKGFPAVGPNPHKVTVDLSKKQG